MPDLPNITAGRDDPPRGVGERQQLGSECVLDLVESRVEGRLIDTFDRLLPEYWSRANPIDLVGERDPSIPRAVLELLLKWEGCDAVINLGIVGRRQVLKSHGEAVLKADPTYSPEFIKQIHRDFKKFEDDHIAQIIDLMEKYKKPVFGVSMLPDEKHQTVYRRKKHKFKAVFFPAPERAVGAFAKMVQYQEFLSREE